MNGWIVEYTQNGWPEYEIQLGNSEAFFDKNKEVLSIWQFDDADECQKIMQDLRDYRLSITKGD